jgi:hypothetical protein
MSIGHEHTASTDESGAIIPAHDDILRAAVIRGHLESARGLEVSASVRDVLGDSQFDLGEMLK